MTALLLKWLDWPPVVTVASIVVIWALSLVTPPRPTLGIWGLVPALAGLALMVAAAVQMALARTPLNPRARPEVLVTSGVFRLSRNPIYLGDALVIFGATLWLNAPLGLLVLAGFLWLVTRHYIAREERWLLEEFGDRARQWFLQTRRWI